MLENKDYCDYETCVALKELGYVGICDAYYELTGSEDYNRDSFGLSYTRDFIHPDDIDRVAAPLLYQAQKWLREEKKIEVVILGENEIGGPYCADIYTEGGYEGYIHKTCVKYEEALSEGIKAAIEILTNNKNE